MPMEWLIVLMLILIGLVLVLLEFLVFPGVNVAGILGFACIVAGVWFGYSFYEPLVGHLILGGTLLLCGAATWYALRSSTWKRLSLDTAIDASVETVSDSIRIGDAGNTVGRLAPMGNVRVGDVLTEAESISGYIDAGQTVEVVKVLKNKIIVKSKTS